MNTFSSSLRSSRSLRTMSIAVVCASTVVMGSMAPASAHVTASPNKTAPGSYSTVTFAVPHGCHGSPTTSVSITIPEGIYTVKPTRNANWVISKTTVPVNPPIKGKHGDITERTNTVTYTALTPLPNDQRDAFDVLIKLPKDQAGKTLYFPTSQKCEVGETNWSTIPQPGDEGKHMKHPAPHLTISAADEAPQANNGSIMDIFKDNKGLAIASVVSVIASVLALILAASAAFKVFVK